MKPDDSATRFELVPFFHGKILDISEGNSRAFPHFISHLDLREADPCRLETVAGQSLDGVFSSYLLHLMGEDSCKEAVKEWSRCVKPGGHIMIHVPTKNDKALWDVSYNNIVSIMDAAPRGWDMVEYQERQHNNEAATLSVFRLS